MKLLRFGQPGEEHAGIIDSEGRIRDLSRILGDVDGSTLDHRTLNWVRGMDLTTLPVVDEDVRLGPCVGRPGKFVCIGRNYADHAAESGATIPDEPIVFMKPTSALSGPYDPIVRPLGSEQLDWEVELAFVVGEECRYLDEAAAARAIAGYFICNDVSERSFQLGSGGQWTKGKGCDSFGPIGPWLVTADEVPDPLNLSLWLDVNGQRYQDGSTRNMIFSPAFLLSYLSRFMSLQPGDIISTGTPAGIGMGQRPPVYLQDGDVVTLGIDGLGTQRQLVMPSRAPQVMAAPVMAHSE